MAFALNPISMASSDNIKAFLDKVVELEVNTPPIVESDQKIKDATAATAKAEVATVATQKAEAFEKGAKDFGKGRKADWSAAQDPPAPGTFQAPLQGPALVQAQIAIAPSTPRAPIAPIAPIAPKACQKSVSSIVNDLKKGVQRKIEDRKPLYQSSRKSQTTGRKGRAKRQLLSSMNTMHYSRLALSIKRHEFRFVYWMCCCFDNILLQSLQQVVLLRCLRLCFLTIYLHRNWP